MELVPLARNNSQRREHFVDAPAPVKTVQRRRERETTLELVDLFNPSGSSGMRLVPAEEVLPQQHLQRHRLGPLPHHENQRMVGAVVPRGRDQNAAEPCTAGAARQKLDVRRTRKQSTPKTPQNASPTTQNARKAGTRLAEPVGVRGAVGVRGEPGTQKRTVPPSSAAAATPPVAKDTGVNDDDIMPPINSSPTVHDIAPRLSIPPQKNDAGQAADVVRADTRTQAEHVARAVRKFSAPGVVHGVPSAPPPSRSSAPAPPSPADRPATPAADRRVVATAPAAPPQVQSSGLFAENVFRENFFRPTLVRDLSQKGQLQFPFRSASAFVRRDGITDPPQQLLLPGFNSTGADPRRSPPFPSLITPLVQQDEPVAAVTAQVVAAVNSTLSCKTVGAQIKGPTSSQQDVGGPGVDVVLSRTNSVSKGRAGAAPPPAAGSYDHRHASPLFVPPLGNVVDYWNNALQPRRASMSAMPGISTPFLEPRQGRTFSANVSLFGAAPTTTQYYNHTAQPLPKSSHKLPANPNATVECSTPPDVKRTNVPSSNPKAPCAGTPAQPLPPPHKRYKNSTAAAATTKGIVTVPPPMFILDTPDFHGHPGHVQRPQFAQQPLQQSGLFAQTIRNVRAACSNVTSISSSGVASPAEDTGGTNATTGGAIAVGAGAVPGAGNARPTKVEVKGDSLRHVDVLVKLKGVMLVGC